MNDDRVFRFVCNSLERIDRIIFSNLEREIDRCCESGDREGAKVALNRYRAYIKEERQ